MGKKAGNKLQSWKPSTIIGHPLICRDRQYAPNGDHQPRKAALISWDWRASRACSFIFYCAQAPIIVADVTSHYPPILAFTSQDGGALVGQVVHQGVDFAGQDDGVVHRVGAVETEMTRVGIVQRAKAQAAPVPFS